MSNMDHPRVCREKLPYLPSGFRGWGSPPRVRGKAPINRHQAEEHGVTPACAGKSAGTGSRSGASWDHPRVCGEKGAQDFCCCVHAGSPPRMRGKDFTWSFASVKLRITPACAGKRIKLRKRHSICGEKLADEYPDQAARGSPPRVRGKGRKNRIPFASPRITPAYAGKRIKLRKRHSICGDHPRACGEKVVPKGSDARPHGSPPRVRGKVIQHLCACTHCGITPAHAGKRMKSGSSWMNWWDHPRVCGEKFQLFAMVLDTEGSPPRMRGKVCADVIVHIQPGITPAYAGKSLSPG